MKPYWEREGVVIYLGDCLQVMRELEAGSVQAVVTDPPYGIGFDGRRQTTSRHGGRKAYEFRGWDAKRPGKEAFYEMFRVSGKQVIWGGNYFADLLPPSQKWLVWDKGQRIAQSDGELAWTSEGGALRIFTLNRVALMFDVAVHPTQKPLALIRWCIAQVSEPGDTILDPFMGSGTTGVACVQTGRRFIGIEIEEAYCRIAVKRIEAALQQPRLPLDEPDRAEQQAMVLEV